MDCDIEVEAEFEVDVDVEVGVVGVEFGGVWMGVGGLEIRLIWRLG
jgi:hypothetical protein